MGPDPQENISALHEMTQTFLEKVGFDIILPSHETGTTKTKLTGLCCGMPFYSKGFPEVATAKWNELNAYLWKASAQGKYPVLMDMSPCVLQFKTMQQQHLNTRHSDLDEDTNRQQQTLHIFEPAEFVHTFLLASENNHRPQLKWTKKEKTVVMHVPCSSKRMGLEQKFREVVEKCADKVLDSGIPCCGMAGDRYAFPQIPLCSLMKS
jgi:D-lactate dehydrogenase